MSHYNEAELMSKEELRTWLEPLVCVDGSSLHFCKVMEAVGALQRKLEEAESERDALKADNRRLRDLSRDISLSATYQDSSQPRVVELETKLGHAGKEIGVIAVQFMAAVKDKQAAEAKLATAVELLHQALEPQKNLGGLSPQDWRVKTAKFLENKDG